jgi:diguanylate cyclase (GGDEF)-like protein
MPRLRDRTLKEDIITDLNVLHDCLDRMVASAEQKQALLQQFHSFQLKLFALNTLPEMIEYILAQVKLFFGIEDLSLALSDDEAKVAGYLSYGNYDYKQKLDLLLLHQTVLLEHPLPQTPYIGRYDKVKQAVFFPARVKEPAVVIIIPLVRHGQCLGILSLGSDKADLLFTQAKRDFVEPLGFSVAIALENQFNFEMARQLKRVETLVYVNNRRFLEQRLTEALERGERYHYGITCLMCDVDFPNAAVEQDSILLETQVLKTVAETLKRQLRLEDILSYYEGKRFAALLANIPEDIVQSIMQRLKIAIEEQVVQFEGEIIPLSLVVSHASYQTVMQPTLTHQAIALELIKSADANLYAAKQLKNRPKKRVSA